MKTSLCIDEMSGGVIGDFFESIEDHPLCIDEVIDVLIHVYPSPVFLFINKQYNKVCKSMLNKYMNILPRREEDIEKFRTIYKEIMNGNLLLLSNIDRIYSDNLKYKFKIDDKISYMIVEDYYVDSFGKYIEIETGIMNIGEYIIDKLPFWRLGRSKVRGNSYILKNYLR